MDKYQNREAAGKVLADRLSQFANRSDVIVLALPRGGVPVAFEVAITLHLPLDVFVVRKLGVPGHEELAMGAIAANGVIIFNQEVLSELEISQSHIDREIAAEQQELQRREHAYRGQRPFPSVKNKTIILVDDGIATGATVRAAIQALRQWQPARIIVAVPVADPEMAAKIAELADDFICPLQPRPLYAVGAWYHEFLQTTDAEVHTLLMRASLLKP